MLLRMQNVCLFHYYSIQTSFVLLTLFTGFNRAAYRDLSYTVNPGCKLDQCKPTEEGKPYLNLVYIQAVGRDDTIHYLWSTYKVPTVLIVKTSHNATLQVNWEGLLEFNENAISFSEEPLHSTSLLIKELWEFKDKSDEVDMYSSDEIMPLGVSDFDWDDVNGTLQFTEALIVASPQSTGNESTFSNNGTFKIQFSVSAEDTPSIDYPHLWFTSNSSQLKLSLIGFTSQTKWSRFAAEVVALSSPVEGINWKNGSTFSIDDEYSPGVFKVFHLHSPCHSDCKSFIQWKPVAYIGEKATVANSSDARASDYVMSDSGVFQSIATSYFSNSRNISKITWNITFGTSGDGFYHKTKYTAWSVMVGVGEPIMDKMSLLAIIVTSLGLGAPMLIMLGGISFLGYKKCQQKDDDLLLEG